MTVIMGVNLSDRLYIAGDTRVSNLVDGVIVPRHDDIQKVEHLKYGVIIACAGHAGLAKHVVNRLRRAPFISLGIDAIRDNIEEWMGQTVEWYWQRQNSMSSHATFIIGGASSKRRRVLDNSQLQKMNNDLASDEEARRQNIGINQDLFHAMQNSESGESLSLSAKDLVLFSISASYARGVEVEDTRWGDFLLFGPQGLVKDDIRPSDIARLEFSADIRGGEDDDGGMLITAFFNNLIKKRNLEGVGKAVVVSCVRPNESYLIQGAVHTVNESDDPEAPFTLESISHIKVINDVVHRIVDGGEYPLTPVSEYGSDNLVLEDLTI